MKKGIFATLAIASAFLVILDSNAGDCSAAVEPGNARLDNGDVYANFRVLPNACPEGCNGYINYRVHYKNRNGNAHFYSGSAKWRSRKGEDLSIAGKGFEGFCVQSSLGPCRLMNVEIQDASCYDR
jgi:hypothetical protein